MAKPSNFITFRVVDEEKQILKQYCEQTGRQQSDVLREFVRSLEKKLQKSSCSSL
ncbi:molybdenum-pterin binding domain protein [Calothrix sp. NIES-4071]|nr:molybdenum-pterin binding domain protein [Calothrix sp. NIES-4071]BAZ64032.1 molybdenum-pterin binding domain protein [Calothrix sp. NIES-4105]